MSQLEAIYSEVAGGRSTSDQALLQLAYIGITLCFSFVGGAMAGCIMKQACFEPAKPEEAFLDQPYWEVPGLEKPYYFDERGEIASHGEDQTVHGGGASQSGAVHDLETKLKVMEANMGELRTKLVRQRRQSTMTP